MKKVLPMLALRGKYIYPNSVIHCDVSRSKSVRAIEEAMQNDQMIFLDNQIDPAMEDPKSYDLYQIGTLARIRQVVKLPQNIIRVFAEGMFRAEILEVCEEEPIFRVEAAYQHTEQQEFEQDEKEAVFRALKESFEKYTGVWNQMDPNVYSYILMQTDLEVFVDHLATHLPFSLQNKQKLLEEMDLKRRCELMLVLLEQELRLAYLRLDIQEKVKENIDDNQREYMLREQLKVIREELGETNIADEADEFLRSLSEMEAGEEVKDKIKKEISRFQAMGNSAAESAVLRTYIEIMLDVPWEKLSEDSMDLEEAEKILEADHYGLKKVKERVLEYLAARAMSQKKDAAILCLVGPPGTGKTSIARSIARATHKEYVRLSLGGVRDESEIRGHRKTYVGAMPGRIVAAIRQAKVRNPLMLLDEVDKVGKDQRGDTASALLEVLDGEQNEHFRDHYLEVPLDLSGVLFVTTANTLQTIPRPLLDRMEVIEINSYTENEKLHIATEHLIPKQLEKHGLKSEQLTISKKAIWKIARNYTKEAGVRQLERKIGDICRKSAREILEEKKKTIHVTERNLHLYLGKELYIYQMKNEQDEVGIVRGLAWTSVGGDTLEIEVNVMPGEGEILLTGQLGDVMKESARTGISYIRSVSKEYGIGEKFFKEHDIHIHIPEGATPKDGPSAGITMATAMLSAITEKKVRADIAMTGEITLRGRVLPIGGLKEKLLAAKNAGIKTVLVPKENETDVEEISAEITKGLEILSVSHMSEVLKHALIF